MARIVTVLLLNAVLWIRIGVNVDPDPDPAFYFNAVPDPAFYQCGSGFRELNQLKSMQIR
jgi:hypothetical protein